jgi:hypothetical protein
MYQATQHTLYIMVVEHTCTEVDARAPDRPANNDSQFELRRICDAQSSWADYCGCTLVDVFRWLLALILGTPRR